MTASMMVTMRGLTKHLDLEIEASTARGAPLEKGEPVPGCICSTCVMLKAGIETDAIADITTITRRLAKIVPAERMAAAINEVRESTFVLPSPEHLCRLAEAEHGARRTYNGPDLPVELARSVSILDAADRLGLDMKKMGLSYRGPCPVHKGEGRNMSIDPKRGSFKCFVCNAGGDVIDLVQAVRGSSFPAAVRELAGMDGITEGA